MIPYLIDTFYTVRNCFLTSTTSFRSLLNQQENKKEILRKFISSLEAIKAIPIHIATIVRLQKKNHDPVPSGKLQYTRGTDKSTITDKPKIYSRTSGTPISC
jgi:hypothetical protein